METKDNYISLHSRVVCRSTTGETFRAETLSVRLCFDIFCVGGSYNV